jgi:four helix bundle protein
VLKNYKDLQVWQKAYQLCLEIYKGRGRFPKHELYGITAQMRRAAVSIPSNIADGYGRKTTKEYIQFLYVAYGSNCELETQIQLCGDLGYFARGEPQKLQDRISEVERMLKSLINSLERKPSTP